jgi:restriction endonuclease S subunit
LKENDILFSIAGTKMGITGLVDSSLIPANTNQALAIIRSKGDFSPQFLLHYLMASNIQTEIEKLKVGVAQFNLSLKQVNELKIPNISTDVQNQIVNQIEKEIQLVNANHELISVFEQKIKDEINKLWAE